ncbi:hypothetical protein M407DRAFT_34825 [Tulasnella calospora MUT 4182]|uniref:Uncharacterized protein n=1 Tax=Tulasnella calospora MUT 4182 TaxID=1051891 RepID=A0A0C3K2D1_9AGAM|nr:hypothetical protein M407DRAFT_34825 [Tulasnella calospora MUT 4182]
MSSRSNKGNPYNQYRMQLNTIEQDGYAKFKIENEPAGEANKPTWTSIVTSPFDVQPKAPP